MSIISKINNMRKEGANEEQISRSLQEEGVSPREINEAMDQSQVKSAIGDYSDEGPGQFAGSPDDYPQFQYSQPMPEQQQVFESQEQVPAQQVPEQQGYDQYPEYQYQQQPPQLDTEIVYEIAQQAVEEKLRQSRKQVSDLSKAKIELSGKIENIEERLKRIESIIDKLQMTIIGTVSNYGKNITDLKKELQMTQESFSKIISPLNDTMQELKKLSEQKK